MTQKRKKKYRDKARFKSFPFEAEENNMDSVMLDLEIPLVPIGETSAEYTLTLASDTHFKAKTDQLIFRGFMPDGTSEGYAAWFEINMKRKNGTADEDVKLPPLDN